MNLPVIFMHTGYQDYLSHSIQQAQRWGNKVILLGDELNKGVNAEHYLMSDYTENTEKFSNSYQHMTSGNFEFELFCYNRWLILYNFAKQHSIEKLVYLDSDVATFCNFSDKENLLDEKNIARVCMMDNQANYRWCAAACISYWSLKGLNTFKQFLLEAYIKHVDRLQEKWHWRQRAQMQKLYPLIQIFKFDNIYHHTYNIQPQISITLIGIQSTKTRHYVFLMIIMVSIG